MIRLQPGVGAAGNGPNWQIINVEFVVCYVELTDPEIDTQLQPGEQEYISTTTYKQASTFLPAATAGEFTTLVPFRMASMQSIYARFRPFANAVNGASATAAYRKSSSCNPCLSSYYFRIGSSIYPNKPVYLINTITGNGAEAYAELTKSFHALASTTGNATLVYQQYNVSSSAIALSGWLPLCAPGNISG